MITAEKVFGSYKLTKCKLGTEDNSELSEFVSPCAIGSKWTSLTLDSVRQYNDDTSIFRFKLLDSTRHLDLPIGSFFLIRAPQCDHDGDDAVRPYTSITDYSNDDNRGYFDLLCKRYDQWGVKESIQTHFLFTKTNHSFKPPGAASNYVHRLQPGDTLDFKFSAVCLPKFSFPIIDVSSYTLIAVGVGIAPMINLLRGIIAHNTAVLSQQQQQQQQQHLVSDDGSNNCSSNNKLIKVVLLYGVRTVKDILMKELLDEWRERYAEFVTIVYCVGSRWNNIHMGANTKPRLKPAADADNDGSNSNNKKAEYVPPPLPVGFTELKQAELGWVNAEKISKYAFPPSNSTRVVVCGLPGVYEKLCGSRFTTAVDKDFSVLGQLGYSEQMVVKL